MNKEATAPVIVYSAVWCAYCHMAKQYFASKNVEFVDKDIEQDRETYNELMQKVQGNFRGVPVIDIDGEIILGFDRPRIDAALAKRHASQASKE